MLNFRSLFGPIDFSKVDFFLLSIFFLVSIFGLIILASASVQFSDSISGYPFSMLIKQSFHFIAGCLLLFLISITPLSFWERFDKWLLFFGMLLLLLVFMPGIGVEVNGANRWIRIGGIGLQPSEVMKFISIVYVSAYSVRRITDLQTHWFGFFKPAFLISLFNTSSARFRNFCSNSCDRLRSAFFSRSPFKAIFISFVFSFNRNLSTNYLCAMEVGKNNFFY